MSTASAEEITVDGTRRNYIVYVPSNLGKDRPLLISCHGMNQDAAYQRGMLQIESVADTAKFVTVFPNGIDKSWDISGDKDIRYILALIDEMERKYSIDRNCVYLSGFSMGGMFTYHAMTRIADKIAAFAPISGYPMWGGSYTSSRPVPIIHTHGTSDDVVGFSGVASVLAGWVKRNGCPTKAKVQKPYRANHITRHTWGPGENGVEVVLMEMADKGHWISNDNGVKTGDEIWKFCKRFSLNQKDPIVRITSPRSEMKYITYGGPTIAEPFTVEATAKPRQGNIVKWRSTTTPVCWAKTPKHPTPALSRAWRKERTSSAPWPPTTKATRAAARPRPSASSPTATSSPTSTRKAAFLKDGPPATARSSARATTRASPPAAACSSSRATSTTSTSDSMPATCAVKPRKATPALPTSPPPTR